ALFDLLTALLDSWSAWNAAAQSEGAGKAWRSEYLRLTYGCGAYQPYEDLVHAAARATGVPASAPDRLITQWGELSPWSGAAAALRALQGRTRLAVVTNCSERLGLIAASRLPGPWDC